MKSEPRIAFVIDALPSLGGAEKVLFTENLTQERSAEINKVNVSEIPLDDALVMGSQDAKKKVIVFTDPD